MAKGSTVLADSTGYTAPGKGSRLHKQISTQAYADVHESIFKGPSTQQRLKGVKPTARNFLAEALEVATRVK